METEVMSATHPIATREEWLEARLDLLKAEKALTRAGDELAGVQVVGAHGFGPRRVVLGAPSGGTGRPGGGGS